MSSAASAAPDDVARSRTQTRQPRATNKRVHAEPMPPAPPTQINTGAAIVVRIGGVYQSPISGRTNESSVPPRIFFEKNGRSCAHHICVFLQRQPCGTPRVCGYLPSSFLIISNCMLRPFSSSAPAAAAHTFDIEAESQRMEMKFQMESMCAALHSFVLPPYLISMDGPVFILHRSKLMNGIAKMCARKCIYKHDDPELEVAEMACADRCVTKFLQAQNQVAKSCYLFLSTIF